jgi:hypothetical protein
MQRSEISITIKSKICFPYSEETFAVAINTNIFTSHFTRPCSGIRTALARSDAYAENATWGRQEIEMVAKFIRKYIYYGPLVAN